jgi:hypothetical protein
MRKDTVVQLQQPGHEKRTASPTELFAPVSPLTESPHLPYSWLQGSTAQTGRSNRRSGYAANALIVKLKCRTGREARKRLSAPLRQLLGVLQPALLCVQRVLVFAADVVR